MHLKFYGQKLFASSLLCCSIFTLVLVGAIQRVNLFFMSCCVILRDKNKLPPSPRPYFCIKLQPEALDFLGPTVLGRELQVDGAERRKARLAEAVLANGSDTRVVA